MQTRHQRVAIVLSYVALAATFSFLQDTAVYAQTATGPAVFSGLFGSRELDVETPNNPGNDYEMVLHVNDPIWYEDELAYSEDRGWGFEPVYEDDLPFGDRNGSGIFGPFDDSPNDRNNFGLDDEHYNSFIGFKSHPVACDEFLFDPEDRNGVCADEIEPTGGIFRVDVPNGTYSFVAVFGDSQHNHAHRALVEDGGEGPPKDIGDNHVVLVGNHNSPDYVQYVLSDDFPGSDLSVGRDMDEGGNLAAVGFPGSMPPAPQSDPEEQPLFVFYDEAGLPIVDDDGAPIGFADVEDQLNAPVLEVTQGYVRLHLLQANSNAYEDEDGFLYPADANGTDVILFEVIPVEIVGGLTGDYNQDGVLDAVDIDLQSAEMKKPEGEQDLALYDHNEDNRVNEADRTIWVKDLKGTWVGDSNFDREFNSGDLVAVFAAGKYETGEMAGWAQGDWDGDMVFDSGDLVAAFSDGGYEQGEPPAVAAVPEPSSLVLALLSLMGLIGISRRRNG